MTLPGKNLSKLVSMVQHEELVVLIWGSGKSKPFDYEKRVKARAEINKLFPNAEVRFGEDPEWEEEIPGFRDLRLHERQLWQLAACDVCVILDTSQGPGEEIARMIDTRFAKRMFILTHEREKEASSFAAALRQAGNQVFYNEQEYRECSVVGRIVERVRLVAFMKFSNLA